MFVAFDPRVRVHLGVVSLGEPPRVRECLAALVAHESRHDFVVSCLANRDAMRPAAVASEVVGGVRIERPRANLGWSGGLHLLRSLSRAELFVWVQDDMVPEPGWLDALVDAADTHPGIGVFGALRVDDDGRVVPHSGGRALPPDAVSEWNQTDTTAQATPTGVTVLDWVTSKGSLTRTEVFDEVGGPDPRLWPLNHVDKDYSTHVRCHGYDVALVPAARLRHAGSQTSPYSFREFLGPWRDGWFDERWGGPATALSGRSSGRVDHLCAEWRSEDVGLVEGVVGREATAMLVPFARSQARILAAMQEQHADSLRSLADRLAETEARLRRAQRRARRLRRRLGEAQAPTTRLPRWARRLRRLP